MNDEPRQPGRSSLESWDGQAELPVVVITPEIQPLVTEAQKLLDAIPWPSEVFTRALVDEAQVAADLARVRELAARCDRLAGGGSTWQQKFGEQIGWKEHPAEPSDQAEAEHFDRMRRRARSVLDFREDAGRPRFETYDEARRTTLELMG